MRLPALLLLSVFLSGRLGAASDADAELVALAAEEQEAVAKLRAEFSTRKAKLLEQHAASPQSPTVPIKSPPLVHTFFEAGGLNNVIGTTQKNLCIAAHVRRTALSGRPPRCLQPMPMLSSHAKGGHVREHRLEDFFVLSPSARSVLCSESNVSAPPANCTTWNHCIQTVGLKAEGLTSGEAPPCVDLKCVYADLPDLCNKVHPVHSALALPDFEAMSDRVIRYARHLVTSMGLGAWGSWTVAQYRFGSDWAGHNGAFAGACIPFAEIQRQVSEGEPSGKVLVMKPLRKDAIAGSNTVSIVDGLDRQCDGLVANLTDGSAAQRTRDSALLTSAQRSRWTSFCHSPQAGDTMRILAESYLASQARAYYYNSHSTFQHLIRRLKSNTTRMVQLKGPHSRGRDDPACKARML